MAMDKDKTKFFLKFYECGNCQPDSEKQRKLQCIPGQKSFFFSLFDDKPPAKAKPDASKQCKKKDEACECPDVCEKEDSKPLPEICKKACVVCFIKEQNPREPECCEPRSWEDDEEDDGGPCPPRGYVPPEERAPSCGCDLCLKDGFHGRCCDPRLRTGSSHRLERA